MATETAVEVRVTGRVVAWAEEGVARTGVVSASAVGARKHAVT
jgi:hypothetical protein